MTIRRRLLIFPGLWLATTAIIGLSNASFLIAPVLSLLAACASYDRAFGQRGPAAPLRWSIIARKSFVGGAMFLAMVFVSVVLPFELSAAVSDPIGEASDAGWPSFLGSDPILVGSSSNGHGEVATLRTQGFLLLVAVHVPYYVFVHGAGEVESHGNVAFRYYASDQNSDAPTITWTGPSSLRITVARRGLDMVTKQSTSVDGIDISYVLPRPERPPALDVWQRLREANRIW